jgi:hypothetical protein
VAISKLAMLYFYQAERAESEGRFNGGTRRQPGAVCVSSAMRTGPLSEAGNLSEPLRRHLSFLVEEHGKETAMRTYYRGPDALVTQERFVWRTSSPRIFIVRELHQAVLVRCNVPDRRLNPALLMALVLTALATASWLLVSPAVGAAIGFLAVLTAAAALASRPRRTMYEWQVRATYMGSHVTVYASVDQRVFNQVARALRRAIEDGRPARTDQGLAAA